LPIGTDSVLSNFKLEVLQQFYKQWYRPNLMAVVVVGDIDPALAETKIKAHFSKFQNPANAPERPAIIPIKQRTKAEAMVITDEEATNTILQIYNFVKPAKQMVTWADYRESIVENLMVSLINQRLQELTQKENPPFVYGFTGMSPFLRGYQAFTSFAVLGDNTAQEAVDALIAETEKAKQFGFLNTELERAKASLLNGAERAFNEKNKSESGIIVWQYVNHFLQKTPIPGVENRYQFIKQALPSITLDEVNGLAKKMPDNTNAFALITAPNKEKDKLPNNEALLNTLIAATGKPVTAYEEKAIVGKLMETEPTPGKITSEKKNEKLGTTELTLSNGITVTLKPTTLKNDQVLMDAWRWGGFHKFDLSEKSNAQYAANVVQEMGVKDLSSIDLRKYLAGKTVSVSPYMNAHEEGIEGSSSVKDFETFLQLTYLYFTVPRKDEKLFNSFVKREKGSVQFLKQDPELFYQDTLMKIVYKNNPWSNMLPSAEDYDKLSLDKISSVYNQVFGNAHGMHFTFVGNLAVDAVKPLLEKYLGSLPASPKENLYKDNKIRPVKGVVNANIKKGKEKQSMITLMFTGEAKYTREENLKLRALLDAMNIEVTEKLREEMSGIYGGGFSGSIVKRPYESYTITASMPCGPENVDKLTTALINIIKNAQQKGVAAKDLQKVKETWKKQYKTNVQSNDFWLSSLSNDWINRLNPEDVLDYEKRVDKLTVDDLKKTAQKYLNLNNYVKAVLYPEGAKIAETKPVKAF
jgi:zinc protease